MVQESHGHQQQSIQNPVGWVEPSLLDIGGFWV